MAMEKNKMLWLNFLHIYQPPTLEKELLVKITKEAYFNIVRILKEHPKYKITLNISGCLTEYLFQVGNTKLIADIKSLVKKGQIELTGSAAFHPLLPLLPVREIAKQITINNDINKNYFGSVYKPKGFYLPEMAYSDEVAKVIKKLGFKWIILDEIALDGKINNGHVDYTKKYKIRHIGLNVVFRNRKVSKTFVPETIEQLLLSGKRPEVVISATDGELYGHKYEDHSKVLQKILKNKELETATISEFLAQKREEITTELKKSTWESTPAELTNKIPYSLWQHPKNNIHKRLWQLANFALQLNYSSTKDPNHFASRLHLEKGLASCTFWWASDKDFKMFNDPAWSPGEVEKGALELLRSIRALFKIDYKDKIKAEKMFLEIHKEIWTKHWSKFKKPDKNLIEKILGIK
jgi:alpha-amylase/alpha-mannosidase (GH57 family)